MMREECNEASIYFLFYRSNYTFIISVLGKIRSITPYSKAIPVEQMNFQYFATQYEESPRILY